MQHFLNLMAFKIFMCMFYGADEVVPTRTVRSVSSSAAQHHVQIQACQDHSINKRKMRHRRTKIVYYLDN